MITPQPIMMANLGMSDTLILMVLALVVFGPRRLPQIGRQIGKLMYEFRKVSNDFKFQMDEEFRKSEEADRRKKEEEERQRALAAGTPLAQLESPASQAPETGAAEGEAAPDPPLTLYPNYPIEPYPGDEGAPTGETVPPAAAETAPPAEAETIPPAAAEIAPPAEAETIPPAAEPTVPRAVPRIQPPSTGETVAAERPGKVPEVKAPESFNSEALASEPEAERSEPAAHHG